MFCVLVQVNTGGHKPPSPPSPQAPRTPPPEQHRPPSSSHAAAPPPFAAAEPRQPRPRGAAGAGKPSRFAKWRQRSILARAEQARSSCRQRARKLYQERGMAPMAGLYDAAWLTLTVCVWYMASFVPLVRIEARSERDDTTLTARNVSVLLLQCARSPTITRTCQQWHVFPLLPCQQNVCLAYNPCSL